MFSDQQIITGISILLAAYVGLVPPSITGQKPLSVYHWQIATYLAWMSSNVHLTYPELSSHLVQQNRVLYVCRIIGMAILLVLLLSALVPTLTVKWFDSATTSVLYGTPASCFWGYQGELDPNTPLSFGFLIVSYVWKVGQLHDTSREQFRKWMRSTPEYILERLTLSVLPANWKPNVWQRGVFRAIVVLYVPFVAMCEFIELFAASLWLVTLGLIWGSLQIFLPRQ